MDSLENKVQQIVKFIEGMYRPLRTKVINITIGGKKKYIIGVYFKEIPDEYITHSSPADPKKHKEYNLTDEIRTYVENYLGIKTTGIQLNKGQFANREDHGITIVTSSEEK